MTNTNNKDLTSTNFGKDNENKFDTASNVNTFDKNNNFDKNNTLDTNTKTTFDKDNNFNSYDKVNTYDNGVNEYPNNTYNRSLSANTLKEYEVKNTNYSTRDFALGFTVGVSLGTLLGLLFAPKKDDKRGYDNADYKGSYLKGNQYKEDNKPSAVDQLKDKAAEIKDKAADKVAEVKDKAQDTQNKTNTKNDNQATGYNEATSHVTTKVETDTDALAAQRRAIKDEVNDNSLKEPIAVVDKDLNTNKTTSKSNNSTKVNPNTKVDTTKTDFKPGNTNNKNNKK
ncbi:YtxH domain-containing protein [Macrococcus equipercicus]|uniref:YtxH domain-containing protein n=1 Tax=Macrococcus equipercicus TaxID=69967 RepID=A0A9Q9BPA8_9STAP|nr:YtxH domain-containing protein [Macrococcus equipercicus]KAA1038412.1 YtxH domain-containing protein [Macrococcus equipercicus]UTH13201.1 YtxH domain-containing protein [Macrococcus equipercicus]